MPKGRAGLSPANCKMLMKSIRLIYFALLTLVSASSCSQEDAPRGVTDWTDKDIYFTSTLSDIPSSRGWNMTFDDLESFQVTCFASELDANQNPILNKDGDGHIIPYFENATFVRKSKQLGVATFVSSPDEPAHLWPKTGGPVSFFAFSPSLLDMEAQNSAVNADEGSYFKLVNRSTEANHTIAVDYRLTNFRVNPDISRQVDFIAAQASGGRYTEFASGVNLDFRHQLSQVELRAWGSGEIYDIEIAGVRLGNPAVDGSYVFSETSVPSISDNWDNDKTTGKVEYIYCGSGDPETRDKIFLINNTVHNTQQSAQSIMGNGGCAMVIPAANARWEGLADPGIGVSPYSTGRMYFSILLRVAARGDGKQIYPYPGNPYGMKVIYYAVDPTDAIITRLYPGLTQGSFFTDSALRNPYVAAEGEKIKEYGWAAVPVDTDWNAGQRYVYTLNYSDGVGLRDPEDPGPGQPIISNNVLVNVTVSDWLPGTDNGVEVPRK